MRRMLALVVLAVGVTVGVIVVLSGLSPSTHRNSTARASTTHDSSLPILRETFTLLPCNSRTTLGLEGCAEHQLVIADREVNRLRHVVTAALFDGAARQRFFLAESLWLEYRQAACRSESDVHEGGSLAPVDFALCAVRLDRQHVAALKLQASSYQVDVQG